MITISKDRHGNPQYTAKSPHRAAPFTFLTRGAAVLWLEIVDEIVKSRAQRFT
jgi:hypothetical protein